MLYKEYQQQYLGGSDVAALVLAGFQTGVGVVANVLKFGEDNDYKAYIVDEKAEIGSHYKKVAEYRYWMTVYDDTSCTAKFRAEKITVYRAGDYGCIIQLDNRE